LKGTSIDPGEAEVFRKILRIPETADITGDKLQEYMRTARSSAFLEGGTLSDRPSAAFATEARKKISELSPEAGKLMEAENITKQYELDLAQERREAQSIIASAQKGAQEIVALEIKQAQKDTEQLVTEATNQLNSQKEKALKALEEQVNTLSEQIKNKLISKQLVS
jgi:F0F1-type ATP synthase membrane subunit b/b'